jgi:hypothetical protein
MSEAVKSASEQKKEDWMNSKWRPMMGWMYMLVCTMDMVIFPVLWSLLQTTTGTAITQWNPLTLQGAGLFHIAMGAVLGIAAFGRTQEKLGGANNGGLQSMAPSGPTTFGSAPAAGGFGAPATPNFGTAGSTTSFGGGSVGSTPRTTPSFGTPAVAATGAAVGFGAAQAMPTMAKPMPSRPPIDEDFPEIN